MNKMFSLPNGRLRCTNSLLRRRGRDDLAVSPWADVVSAMGDRAPSCRRSLLFRVVCEGQRRYFPFWCVVLLATAECRIALVEFRERRYAAITLSCKGRHNDSSITRWCALWHSRVTGDLRTVAAFDSHARLMMRTGSAARSAIWFAIRAQGYNVIDIQR